MMKFLTTALFLGLSFLSSSQTQQCNYKIQVDTEEEKFFLTQEVLVDYILGKDKNVFIYFSGMREGDVKSLVLQFSVNATVLPPALCFNKDSRVSFKLEDGSFVSLRYLGEKICGRQTENEDTLHNSTSDAAFLIDDIAFERLSSSKTVSMRITTMKSHFDIKFQELISNPQIELPIYPKEFFMNTLKCLE
ncbi:hypothetical protein [Marinirhabdus gelatinilytica]|uniref:Tissue inhibitor of metalloproteinase n=1 Tax=Marinirhabdus gelatinilytica TaxID=1703343 RepID=A0A370QAG7_9FLAO|nr:hypothetical protein [Marinirhabdus gelatinilytica]RDK85289.1 hypothetical protein C8D94_103107 [Marinirhabdus gelatinilytica]